MHNNNSCPGATACGVRALWNPVRGALSTSSACATLALLSTRRGAEVARTVGGATIAALGQVGVPGPLDRIVIGDLLRVRGRGRGRVRVRSSP